MEFWGVEVKAGKPLKVLPEEGKLIHISQAALGEGKKGNENVPLHLKIDEKDFVVGTLSAEKIPQFTFDLVLEKEFELSHGWKNGSVYFCGYQADNADNEGEGSEFSSDDDDEFLPVDASHAIENGKLEAKVEQAKPVSSKANAKPKVTLVEPSKDDGSDSDDVAFELDSDDSEDEDLPDVGDEFSDEDGSTDEDEETPTPKKADPGKKRPVESATKTPTPAKKAKLATPQKTDGKKGGHTATPHPAKQAGKTPASSNNSKEQTPKSVAQVSCKSCTKTFNSESALQSHSKAKHGAK